MTIKLTEMQRAVLSSACSNELGLVTRPAGLKPAQVTKMTAVLVDAGLVKEIRAKAGSPVWRKDEAGTEFALKVLKAGRAMVTTIALATPTVKVQNVAVPPVAADAKPLTAVGDEPAPRAPKQTAIVALMQRPDGASIADLIAATGWLPHTTRAALSGSAQKGLCHRAQPGRAGRRIGLSHRRCGLIAMARTQEDRSSVSQRRSPSFGTLDAAALQRRWRTLVGGTMPADLGRPLTLRVLAYKLQAQQLGDLDKASLRELAALSSAVKVAADEDKSRAAEGARRRSLLKEERSALQHQRHGSAKCRYASPGPAPCWCASMAACCTGS